MDRNPPELWFEGTTLAPTSTLLHLVRCGKLTVTPRLGVRNEHHQNGYVAGEIAVVRVRNNGRDLLVRHVRITSVASKRLCEFTVRDLGPTFVYSGGWEGVRKDLSHFAGYHVDADEMASLVAFEYVNTTVGGEDAAALEAAPTGSA